MGWRCWQRGGGAKFLNRKEEVPRRPSTEQLTMHHHPGPQTHRRIKAGRGAAAGWPSGFDRAWDGSRQRWLMTARLACEATNTIILLIVRRALFTAVGTTALAPANAYVTATRLSWLPLVRHWSRRDVMFNRDHVTESRRGFRAELANDESAGGPILGKARLVRIDYDAFADNLTSPPAHTS